MSFSPFKSSSWAGDGKSERKKGTSQVDRKPERERERREEKREKGKRLKMGRGVNIFLSAFAFGCKKLYLCISKGSTRVLPFFRFRPAGGLIRPKRAFERAVPDLQKRLFELLTTAL